MEHKQAYAKAPVGTKKSGYFSASRMKKKTELRITSKYEGLNKRYFIMYLYFVCFCVKLVKILRTLFRIFIIFTNMHDG